VRRRRFWGWGWEDAGPTDEHALAIGRLLTARFGGAELSLAPIPALDDLVLAAPRVAPPAALAPLCSQTPYDRAGHTYGKSFRDVVADWAGTSTLHPTSSPFRRRRPTSQRSSTGARARGSSPFHTAAGRASSAASKRRRAATTRCRVDRPRPARSRARDRPHLARGAHPGRRPRAVARRSAPAARLDAPALPTVVRVLDPRRLDRDPLGGHYATLYTHIDDFVESLRVVTPAGTLATRRLPGSGAGPSPDRLFLGSEGTLGVIVEAWMRLQDPADVPRDGLGGVRRRSRAVLRRPAGSHRRASSRRTAGCSIRARR
jgi:alkyldihydroxyacetonephosphate synthase